MGLTHLHSCYALVEFPSSAVCQQALETSYQLRGQCLLWYHPSVVTCYKCGEHGHFQASCTVKPQVTQVGHMGVRQDGVTYATAVQPRVGVALQQRVQPHTSSRAIQPMASVDVHTSQATAARLDALEMQIDVIAKSLQALLTHVDIVTGAVASVG